MSAQRPKTRGFWYFVLPAAYGITCFRRSWFCTAHFPETPRLGWARRSAAPKPLGHPSGPSASKNRAVECRLIDPHHGKQQQVDHRHLCPESLRGKTLSAKAEDLFAAKQAALAAENLHPC